MKQLHEDKILLLNPNFPSYGFNFMSLVQASKK